MKEIPGFIEDNNIPKKIWVLWLQGWEDAPEIVKICYRSWRVYNHNWEVIFLDQSNLKDYLPDNRIETILKGSKITSTSFSDLVRIRLLSEYGGVWADATLLCSQPLDSWLPQKTRLGFFAFERPGPDRPIATWFIAASENNFLTKYYLQEVYDYWQNRAQADDYFWFHYCFRTLLLNCREALDFWKKLPRVSAEKSHFLFRLIKSQVSHDSPESKDWAKLSPVHKLTHRSENSLELVHRYLPSSANLYQPERMIFDAHSMKKDFVGIKLSTINLGDNIQATSLYRLLELYDIAPSELYDRDTGLSDIKGSPSIFLSGWFKHGENGWPPAPDLDSSFISFHIRPHQSSALLSEEAIEYYKNHEPVYCRESYTADLLASKGVQTKVSHCFTLSFSQRLSNPRNPQVFVVSRDREILEYLPDWASDHQFRTHYSDTSDYFSNEKEGVNLISEYKKSAGLVITTLLHCALPCIAMGIPTIVCWPKNNAAGHESDKERFASLTDIVPVYDLEQLKMDTALPSVRPVGEIKIRLRRLLARELRKRGHSGFFDQSLLEKNEFLLPPEASEIKKSALVEEQRLRRLIDIGSASDEARWGQANSYVQGWQKRGKLAADLLPSGMTVLELGAGTGTFEQLISNRCHYTGSDLKPINSSYLKIDLNQDAIPSNYDYIVALGVLEYTEDIKKVVHKISQACKVAVVSYCCAKNQTTEALDFRREKDWVNSLSDKEFVGLFADVGFSLEETIEVVENRLLSEKVFRLSRV